MYVYYLHFYFYLVPTLNQGITRPQNSYLLSLHPLYFNMRNGCDLALLDRNFCISMRNNQLERTKKIVTVQLNLKVSIETFA